MADFPKDGRFKIVTSSHLSGSNDFFISTQMIFSSILIIWVRWVSQIHRKVWLKIDPILWAWLRFTPLPLDLGGKEKGKKGVHIQVSALIHSVASYNLDISQLLLHPSKCRHGITNFFIQLSSLHQKHRHQNPQTLFLVLIPVDPHTYRFLIKRGLKISNYKIIRIWLYDLVYRQ